MRILVYENLMYDSFKVRVKSESSLDFTLNSKKPRNNMN